MLNKEYRHETQALYQLFLQGQGKGIALKRSKALQNEGADVLIDKWEIKIGERSELLDAVRTGFKADDGKQIMGYPDMILYHAERCKENDPKNRYRDKLDRIVDIYKRV